MTLTDDRIRELLGVEANVDLEAELTKLKASMSGGGDGNTDPPKKTEHKDDGGDEGGEGAKPEGTPPADPAGMVQISQKVLDELIVNAGAGAQAAETIAERDREAELVSLSRAGIIQPSEIEHMKELLKVAPDATRKMLSARAPSFPTVALGGDDGGLSRDQGLDAAFSAVESAYWRLDSEAVGGK